MEESIRNNSEKYLEIHTECISFIQTTWSKKVFNHSLQSPWQTDIRSSVFVDKTVDQFGLCVLLYRWQSLVGSVKKTKKKGGAGKVIKEWAGGAGFWEKEDAVLWNWRDIDTVLWRWRGGKRSHIWLAWSQVKFSKYNFLFNDTSLLF